MSVLSGTSTPGHAGKEFDAAPCQVDRLEFNVWKALPADDGVPTPVFSDYGIVYQTQNTDNVPVQAPSRIRLSTFGKHHLNRFTPDGYRDLRKRVAKEMPALSQVDCIGTRAIFGRGHGFTGVGNATDWITRDMDAHWETTLGHIARVRRRAGVLDEDIAEAGQLQPWLQDAFMLNTDTAEHDQ